VFYHGYLRPRGVRLAHDDDVQDGDQEKGNR
jgi:hypothetical protein